MTRGKAKQGFTAAGVLVQERDDKGLRSWRGRCATRGKPRQNKAPRLEPQPGDTVLRYEYALDDDRIGRVKSRQPR